MEKDMVYKDKDIEAVQTLFTKPLSEIDFEREEGARDPTYFTISRFDAAQKQISDISLLDDPEFQAATGIPVEKLYRCLNKYWTENLKRAKRTKEQSFGDRYEYASQNADKNITRAQKVVDCLQEAIKTKHYSISQVVDATRPQYKDGPSTDLLDIDLEAVTTSNKEDMTGTAPASRFYRRDIELIRENFGTIYTVKDAKEMFDNGFAVVGFIAERTDRSIPRLSRPKLIDDPEFQKESRLPAQLLFSAMKIFCNKQKKPNLEILSIIKEAEKNKTYPISSLAHLIQIYKLHISEKNSLNSKSLNPSVTKNFDAKDIEAARNAFSTMRRDFALIRNMERFKDLEKLSGDVVTLLLKAAADITKSLPEDLIDDAQFQAVADIPAKDIFSAVHKHFFIVKPWIKFSGHSKLIEAPPPRKNDVNFEQYNRLQAKIQHADAMVDITEKSMRDETYPLSTLVDMIRIHDPKISSYTPKAP
jgi:hypothetical protein